MGEALRRLLVGIELQRVCKVQYPKFVGIRGLHSAKVVVVGEAPGADEDQSGQPFCGFSGKEQDRMLVESGFSLSDVWFTNPYKLRPPGNQIELIETLGIPRQLFIDAFLEELHERKPVIIIPVGNTPLSILCPETATTVRPKKKGGEPIKKVEITKWRGSLLTSPLLSWEHYVIPNVHPAHVLRNWGERPSAVLCYRKACFEFEYWRNNRRLLELPRYDLLIAPEWPVLKSYLLECLDSPHPISADIEMLRRLMPYVLGLAVSKRRAASFCLWDYAANTKELFRLCNRILNEKQLIGQNFLSFDSHWLSTIALQPNVNEVDDILVRHHVLWPELEHKLQVQTWQYTRQSYYKDEGRNINIKKPEDKRRLMHYNALDVCIPYEIYEVQEREFESRINVSTIPNAL